jgi:hypothetical protein
MLGSVLTNAKTPGQNNQSSQVKNESKIVEWNWDPIAMVQQLHK